jgi:nucleotide-binding universal stress UspA family protein
MQNAGTGTLPFVSSVLHPTDFSPASDRAFAHALAIAVIRQTELTILHVDPSAESDVEWSRFPPVRKYLERWGLLEPGSARSAIFDELSVRVTKVAVRGRQAVLETAGFVDGDPPDLIVLATEGREGPSRWFNRSDAEAMARWTKTMTLFVPADANRGLVSLDSGNLTLKNILVPVDTVPDCTAAAILAAAESHAADLIVMATAGHDGVLDALRGSTTEQVLRRASCPLLAVPTR